MRSWLLSYMVLSYSVGDGCRTGRPGVPGDVCVEVVLVEPDVPSDVDSGELVSGGEPVQGGFAHAQVAGCLLSCEQWCGGDWHSVDFSYELGGCQHISICLGSNSYIPANQISNSHTFPLEFGKELRSDSLGTFLATPVHRYVLSSSSPPPCVEPPARQASAPGRQGSISEQAGSSAGRVRAGTEIPAVGA